ncbi:hypothetical protein BH10PSE7_BH10PSE7_08030 [soil metagenome]
MANISGTSGNDFIHRKNDGYLNPGGIEKLGVTAGKDTISGGAGQDAIYGDDGADHISGGTGNDVLTGGQGTDNLSGGIGRDVFAFDDVSEISGLAETINGGSDVDSLDFQSLNAEGAVNLSKAALSSVEQVFLVNNTLTLKAAQLGGFSVITGSGNAERIILSSSGVADLTGATINAIEEFRGSSGNDKLTFAGVTSGQTINTLAGLDTVTGSDGNDVVDGGAGNDNLSGGDGDDQVTGGSGSDRASGGDGDDVLVGGAGRDALFGGEGADTFRFAIVSDITALAETIAGGADVDRIDFLTLGAVGVVDMTTVAISGVEQLQLVGNDARFTSAQLDAFSTISGAGPTERIIIADAGTVDLSGAQVSSIEEIRGSGGANTIILTDVLDGQFVDARGGNDTVRGSRAADTLVGGDGRDQLSGDQGTDVIRGGQGADRLSGGIGNDTFQLEGVSDISGLAETINGGADTDRVDLNSFNATGKVDLTKVVFTSIEALSLSNNDATITAAQLSAFDTVSGGGGTDRITLSAAGAVNLSNADIINIEEFRGTGGADTFNFSNVPQGQTAFGLGGNDILKGGTGVDLLDGGAGADTITGGDGGDVIVGGDGKDLLTGGALADRFDFLEPSQAGNGGGRDVIVDFKTGVDVINLRSIDADTSQNGDQFFTFGAFNGDAGRLRYVGGILEGDTDGNNVADFQIQFTGTPVIAVGDILL